MKNKIVLGCLAAATCEILFGLSFIFTKSITAQVSDLALISWRFVTAFLFINLYFLISRRRININGRNLKPLTRIAILNPIIYFICETIGIIQREDKPDRQKTAVRKPDLPPVFRYSPVKVEKKRLDRKSVV